MQTAIAESAPSATASHHPSFTMPPTPGDNGAWNVKQHEQRLKEGNQPHVYWVAWHLQTPVDICQQWNHLRDRQVPHHVIENYQQQLEPIIPPEAKSFLKIFAVTVAGESTPDSPQYTINVSVKNKIQTYTNLALVIEDFFHHGAISRSIVNLQNRINNTNCTDIPPY